MIIKINVNKTDKINNKIINTYINYKLENWQRNFDFNNIYITFSNFLISIKI